MPDSMSTVTRIRRATLVLVASLAAVPLMARPAEAITDPVITGGSTAEHGIVREAWNLVLDAFPRLHDCISNSAPDVTIRRWNHVGTYDFRTDTIILRSGGFRLADAVHEFAHHLDWECGFEAKDEDELYATTDLPGWLRDSSWKYKPVEIFAETIVKLVLGPEASSAGGRASLLHPDQEIQEIVARWCGEDLPHPALRSPGAFPLVPV